jgi:DNA-binding transcriptional LysR family regulator
MKIHYTLDQLIVLEAIVRTGSFAAAAKELYRVPSAISYSISCLEDALELTLFDRSKRKAYLTKEGNRIYNEALELLQASSGLQRLSHQFKGGWEPELQIIVDGIIPMESITTALRPFATLDIPTRIRLDIEYQEGVPDRFFADKADLMIILDFTDTSGELEVFPLSTVELVMVVSPDHPIATLEEVTDADLQPHMDLVVRDSSPKYAQMPKESSFMNSKNLLFLSDFHSKRLALLGGIGYGWMPQYLIKEDLEAGTLTTISKEVNRWSYSPSLVKRKDHPLGKAGQLFYDALMNHQVY